MRIALGFWGLTRSLKYTVASIEQHILHVLKRANIDYTIFLHTYSFSSEYTNTRTGEIGIQLDFTEYTLLHPDFVQVDNQDEVKANIDVTRYRSRRDPWNSGYQSVDNFLCSMYSKRELGRMIQTSGIEFDYVLFLRPDVVYLHDFDVSMLSLATDTTVCIPNFALWGPKKFNDRFCLTKYSNAFKYSELFEHMLDYSRRKPLHSEIYQATALCEWHKLHIQYVPFFFNRVRANGCEQMDCTHDEHSIHRTRFFDGRGRFINRYVRVWK